MQRRAVNQLLLLSTFALASGSRLEAKGGVSAETADEAALRRTREGIGGAFRRGELAASQRVYQQQEPLHFESRFATAARMKPENNGCGANGLILNSG